MMIGKVSNTKMVFDVYQYVTEETKNLIYILLKGDTNPTIIIDRCVREI